MGQIKVTYFVLSGMEMNIYLQSIFLTTFSSRPYNEVFPQDDTSQVGV